MCSAAGGIDVQGPHELRKANGPRTSSRPLGLHRFGRDPGQQEPGKIPEGEFTSRRLPSCRACKDRVDALVLKSRSPGLVRGNEHSAIIRAMKPRSASASLAVTN